MSSYFVGIALVVPVKLVLVVSVSTLVVGCSPSEEDRALEVGCGYTHFLGGTLYKTKTALFVPPAPEIAATQYVRVDLTGPPDDLSRLSEEAREMFRVQREAVLETLDVIRRGEGADVSVDEVLTPAREFWRANDCERRTGIERWDLMRFGP